jgi:GNAT superfamily N-acetyltransferase
MFRVRTMSPEDFEYAVQITDQMSWNLAIADFEFMTELEPDGCFILLENSQRIGLATTVNFGNVAWFGNLIVDEKHQKRGAGSLLVEHSVRYLTGKQAKTIGLYAYVDKIPFYERLGFKNDSEFTVLEGRGTSLRVESNVRRAKRSDLQEILEFDSSCFGASRKKLLEPIIGDPDNLCYISMQGGRTVGYVVAKVYKQMGEIGPMVCQGDREDMAISLLNGVLNKLRGREVSMCIPKRETVVLDTLNKLGFNDSFRVSRMYLGPPIIRDCINVAESLERG